MLKLIAGPSDYDITRHIIEQIGRRAEEGVSGQILIVPEQYSHSVERLLCEICPDNISLYAQVLSFRRLARRVFEHSGGTSRQMLSDGGKLLTMAVCLHSVRDSLSYFSRGPLRPELCRKLLEAVKELKNAYIEPQRLSDCSAKFTGSFSAKLRDISILYSTYNSLTSTGPGDPEDELSFLASVLETSSFADGRDIYISGFTDFTAQQLTVVRRLMESAGSMTVGLSNADSGSVQQKTSARLADHAALAGIKCEQFHIDGSGETLPELEHLRKYFFDYTCSPYGSPSPGIVTLLASDMEDECTVAACSILRLVRENGWRYRDFTVAVRGFERYRTSLECVFDKFGIPLYTGSGRDVSEKPEIRVLIAAMKTVLRGFEYEDVFTFLKTGLGPLGSDDTDLLENYVLQWGIRGSGWTREADWQFHPEGKGGNLTGAQELLLEKINELRLRVRAPLLSFSQAISSSETARDYCTAVYDFAESIDLRGKIEEKYRHFSSAGKTEKADEYRQLWGVICDVLDQFVNVASDVALNPEEFLAFFEIIFSRYRTGVIPVSVDMVSSGDLMDIRAGRVRCLLVLGADDTSLPPGEDESEIFTERDRKALREFSIDLSVEDRSGLQREMDIIRSSFSVPSNMYYISCPLVSGGQDISPSFVIKRLRSLFPDPGQPLSGSRLLSQSSEGCFLLACRHIGGEADDYTASAYSVLSGDPRITSIARALTPLDESISEKSVSGLYGSHLLMTPSRAEQFNSCKFAYYMQYGLKAKPRISGAFQAQDAGIYMHFLLQNICHEASLAGGFKNVTPDVLELWTRKYTEQYVRNELYDFKDRSKRFVYLFERLTRSAFRIVSELAGELSNSSFTPLAFELNFGPEGDIPQIEIPGTHMSITGTTDRVDGWTHNGKLYIRIVDYKTGRKSFDLSDVWNGLSLQMLIYLFALQNSTLFEGEVIPAGVLYVPARDPMIRLDVNKNSEKAESDREKELRRSGLLLNDKEVISAMEHSEKPRYLPISVKGDGTLSGSLANPDQFRQLSAFVDDTIKKMYSEIERGCVDADPYFSGASSACDYCDYSGACRYESSRRKKRNLSKISSDAFWQELDRKYKREGTLD